jgi:hypothetical protein
MPALLPVAVDMDVYLTHLTCYHSGFLLGTHEDRLYCISLNEAQRSKAGVSGKEASIVDWAMEPSPPRNSKLHHSVTSARSLRSEDPEPGGPTLHTRGLDTRKRRSPVFERVFSEVLHYVFVVLISCNMIRGRERRQICAIAVVKKNNYGYYSINVRLTICWILNPIRHFKVV